MVERDWDVGLTSDGSRFAARTLASLQENRENRPSERWRTGDLVCLIAGGPASPPDPAVVPLRGTRRPCKSTIWRLRVEPSEVIPGTSGMGRGPCETTTRPAMLRRISRRTVLRPRRNCDAEGGTAPFAWHRSARSPAVPASSGLARLAAPIPSSRSIACGAALPVASGRAGGGRPVRRAASTGPSIRSSPGPTPDPASRRPRPAADRTDDQVSRPERASMGGICGKPGSKGRQCRPIGLLRLRRPANGTLSGPLPGGPARSFISPAPVSSSLPDSHGPCPFTNAETSHAHTGSDGTDHRDSSHALEE